ncbi:MAG: CDP-alcohol phosphatidyltransferase family protein [Marivibrio sp.]|uniref:CDP-alcohol phosphatidyltransferase family protein n=1 Tax=Marivibrio sp. TaxID=2039719 RepID=UPI0032F0385E
MPNPIPYSSDDSAALGALKRAAGGAVALGLLATLAIAGGVGLLLGAPTPVAASAAAIYLAAAGVGWRWLAQHLPNRRLGAANAVTITRAALVACLAGLLPVALGVGAQWTAAAGWCAIALSTTALSLDGVDGWAARRFGRASPFGARIDQELDALTTLLLAALLWSTGVAGVWVLAAGLWRRLFLAGQALVPALRGALPFSRFRRIACGWSVGLLIAALGPIFPGWLQTGLAALAVGLVSTSFLRDIIWLARTSKDAGSPRTPSTDGGFET